MQLFSGDQRMSLDDKGRMRIPSKFKTAFTDGYVIYAPSNECLFVVSTAEFSRKYSEIAENTLLSDDEKQFALRKLSSTVQIPEEDSQGRFILQPRLKALAKIKKKMVFLGVFNRLEIWDEETYDKIFAVEDLDVKGAVHTLGV